MKKKKETTTHEPTEQSATSRPRRAKLIKKRDKISTDTLTEDSTTPHLISWRGIDGYLDAPSAPFEERIAVRAYERFLERGGHHGQDLEDWIEAEREVLAESPHSL